MLKKFFKKSGLYIHTLYVSTKKIENERQFLLPMYKGKKSRERKFGESKISQIHFCTWEHMLLLHIKKMSKISKQKF
jgi:hypothetical protein